MKLLESRQRKRRGVSVKGGGGGYSCLMLRRLFGLYKRFFCCEVFVLSTNQDECFANTPFIYEGTPPARLPLHNIAKYMGSSRPP